MEKLPVQSIVMDDMVWKVHFTDRYMLVETRDGIKKHFNLLCIDTCTMEVIWKTETAALSWWETIVAVTGRYIVLSLYQDPAFPGTGGLKVMDLSNGSFLWKNNCYNLAEVKSDDVIRVVDTENDQRETMEIKLETGGVLTGFSKGEEGNGAEKERKIIPSFYPEGHEYFAQVASFLSLKGYHPVKAIEYAEIDDKVVIGFYEDTEGGIRFILLVINVKGEVFWEETGTNQRDGIGFGTYFLLKEWIVFVRDKKEIVILSLSI